MMEQVNMKQVGILFAVGLLTLSAQAQSLDMTAKLEQSLAELNRVRSGISDEKLPMVKELNGLEDEVLDVRLEHQQVMRQLDSRNLDLNNLRSEIKTRKDEKNYISNLLSEYTRNFQTRLHIAELNRYQDTVDAAALAPENSNFSDQQVFDRQTALVSASIERLQ